jgi:hypothetical protein
MDEAIGVEGSGAGCCRPLILVWLCLWESPIDRWSTIDRHIWD